MQTYRSLYKSHTSIFLQWLQNSWLYQDMTIPMVNMFFRFAFPVGHIPGIANSIIWTTPDFSMPWEVYRSLQLAWHYRTICDWYEWAAGSSHWQSHHSFIQQLDTALYQSSAQAAVSTSLGLPNITSLALSSHRRLTFPFSEI